MCPDCLEKKYTTYSSSTEEVNRLKQTNDYIYSFYADDYILPKPEKKQESKNKKILFYFKFANKKELRKYKQFFPKR